MTRCLPKFHSLSLSIDTGPNNPLSVICEGYVEDRCFFAEAVIIDSTILRETARRFDLIDSLSPEVIHRLEEDGARQLETDGLL